MAQFWKKGGIGKGVGVGIIPPSELCTERSATQEYYCSQKEDIILGIWFGGRPKSQRSAESM